MSTLTLQQREQIRDLARQQSYSLEILLASFIAWSAPYPELGSGIVVDPKSSDHVYFNEKNFIDFAMLEDDDMMKLLASWGKWKWLTTGCLVPDQQNWIMCILKTGPFSVKPGDLQPEGIDDNNGYNMYGVKYSLVDKILNGIKRF
jgi:hypothetical protein